jgi:hypothetical protein
MGVVAAPDDCVPLDDESLLDGDDAPMFGQLCFAPGVGLADGVVAVPLSGDVAVASDDVAGAVAVAASVDVEVEPAVCAAAMPMPAPPSASVVIAAMPIVVTGFMLHLLSADFGPTLSVE